MSELAKSTFKSSLPFPVVEYTPTCFMFYQQDGPFLTELKVTDPASQLAPHLQDGVVLASVDGWNNMSSLEDLAELLGEVTLHLIDGGTPTHAESIYSINSSDNGFFVIFGPKTEKLQQVFQKRWEQACLFLHAFRKSPGKNVLSQFSPSPKKDNVYLRWLSDGPGGYFLYETKWDGSTFAEAPLSRELMEKHLNPGYRYCPLEKGFQLEVSI